MTITHATARKRFQARLVTLNLSQLFRLRDCLSMMLRIIPDVELEEKLQDVKADIKCKAEEIGVVYN